ncbi:MAG: Sodium:neurotransmitter symporter family protein [Bacteroidetes bacterium ADurb.Bin302]|jgi:neurotransmitter:Na+ symporter, NSS family|nr:MAG: Sodium:neurotransmitter symporter family protein [Bacteroidetes bacterium ADurb.Bin302]HPG55732.1 sodium-dependent transporter [Candidatus Enterocola sp.]
MEKRGGFATKIGILMATVGSAVGLGNIWRFPYETGRNGGAAFLLVYLLSIFIIGFPVVMAEFVIGRKAKANPVGAFKKLAPNAKWHWVGYMGVLAGLLILGYYSVVAGWTMEYVFKALRFELENKSAADYKSMFETFTSNPILPIIWTVLVMIISHLIVKKGIKGGIEKASKIMMPILFLLMLILAVHSILLPGSMKGIEFFFNPDFSKLTAESVLTALGHAFFSLSLGMGCLITYASYFKSDIDLPKTAAQVTIIDTLVSVTAGVIIFPAVFAFNMQPEAGPGLVYMVLPNVFQQMSGSFIWSTMFYILLFLAALTSLISLHEVVTAYIHERYSISRSNSSRIVTALVLFLGVFCSLSFGLMKNATLFSMNFFEWLEYLTASVLLPLGGMLISIFVAWYLDKKIVSDELSNDGKVKVKGFKIYIFILRYVAPLCIFAVFVTSIIK